MKKKTKISIAVGASTLVIAGAGAVVLSPHNEIEQNQAEQVQALTWGEFQDYVNMGNLAIQDGKEFKNINKENPINEIIQGEIITYDFSKTKFKDETFLKTKFK